MPVTVFFVFLRIVIVVMLVRRFIPWALLRGPFEARWFAFMVLVEGVIHHGEVGMVGLKDHAGTTKWKIGLYKFLIWGCQAGCGSVVIAPAG